MKIALFDLDGTLIDSERYYFSIWQELMAREGYQLEKGFYQQVVGSPTSVLKEKIQQHFGEIPMFDDLFKEFMCRRKQAQKEAVFPMTKGCCEYLEYLSEQAITCGIVTSSYQKEAENILENMGLASYFAFGVYGDQVIKGKPDPEIYAKAIQTAGQPVEQIIVYEDSPNGILAAVHAGLSCVHIKNFVDPTPEIEQLVESSCIFFFEVLDGLTLSSD
ncbi:HAD family phosphatase [Enterococcus gilvus]|uniref:HAD family hydrolase n=1 Tax=Enterococcus gilvus TaxID=160453 RepID=UPI00290BA85B|nr:HAD family phosphatase [Enterococcus gilvus]MDU5511223.1 HAD family phosphatase [Enterococcus gilvus]